MAAHSSTQRSVPLYGLRRPPKLAPTSTLEMVESAGCRFMEDDLVQCCGRQKADSGPYCEAHARYCGTRPASVPKALRAHKKVSVFAKLSRTSIDEL